MKTVAIIVAAGRGTRAGGGLPKQWRDLGGKPVVAHSVRLFQDHPKIDAVVLVIHPDDQSRAGGFGVELVFGGATRAQSVANALIALEGRDVARVLIHDGARPFARAALITRLTGALDQGPAAAPALPVTDALWHSSDGRVTAVQPRAGLMRAQTPQAFHFAEILAAHRAHKGDAADDVEIALAAGLDVRVVEGDEENIKLTHAEDFIRAERLLRER